ncbi:MAG: 4Fe-4S binding protein [candidate division KSB1 bacterium]|nr:4Fe-4S binding protein [candidate division KSB1 bacterium]
MRTARRISQVFFLLFFLFLFFQARYPYETALSSDLFLRASPLVAFSTFLASRSLASSMFIALGLLLLTIPLGRFFCGWICPLGTTIDATDKMFKRKHKKPATRFRSWKFFILAFVLAASVFSVQLIWFFDPIALFTRTMTTVIYPAFSFVLFGLFNTLFSWGVLENAVYTTFDFAQRTVLPFEQPLFYQSLGVFAVFVVIIGLGVVSRRFWCRNLCPLGALLGLFSKWRLTQRYVSQACTHCSQCQKSCRMNAIEDDYTINNTVECIECADCVAVCPPNAVSYRFGKNPGLNEIDFSKRHFLQAGAAGLAGVAVVKTAQADVYNKGKAIRPPGAIEENRFLDKCIRCEECVKICASTGGCLQPALLETGWEGMWTPVSVPRKGYCEFNCNMCGQVCPTGAIQELALEKKKTIKLGQAYFDKSRCIPWYSQEDCLVCEEHCPVSDKAIKFDERDTVGPDGSPRTVKFPYLEENLCIGCGICENKCPVVGKPGIFVTASGNQRVQFKG